MQAGRYRAWSRAPGAMGNPVIKVDSRRENLTDLTMEEIEKVIKKLPSPKTPVPDGVSASGTLTPVLDMKIVLKLETWLKKSFPKKILSNTMDSEAHEKRPPILTSSKQDIAPHIANVSEMRHYLCGCCAAFNNIAITFPIQKVLFRQQLYGIKTRDAVLQLRRDGFRNLYRGILPPLMQKTTTLALMFGLYEDLSCLLRKHISTPEFATCSLAAVLAGTTEAIFTPLERVQTLLQDHKHHDKFTNTYQAFKALKCHGIREYYRGLVPVLFRNGFSNVLFFGLRGPIKEHLPTATTHSAHLVNDFICGGLLGAMLGILFFPVNVVKTRMQSQIGGEFQSFPKVFQKIWLERDRKLTNLFRGAHLNYHRSLISWGIINATYEFLLKII
ncbi:mitochondrial nicotinamide adenine dinucleotide transporter SLC25A51 isoform X2 [Eubalaena glacialis]|uniref:mitochondrial nicotinamide adenine dinucleotide transporter SLC25A51 isoform X2 n=2 Tax=Eubalaena glacialis TaxID=27606 RepID=UPI002A5B0C3C|nr:mitochondrial nicotinamide adenine dinucleotide transporter SLC25A51 isoform X2 [Eubalaena glacialis]